MKKIYEIEFPDGLDPDFIKFMDSHEIKDVSHLRKDLDTYIRREKSIPLFNRPQTASEGMRFLAKWFDFVYQDQGTNDAVQIDLRRWADDLDMIKEMAAEPYKSELEVRNALFRIHQRLSN